MWFKFGVENLITTIQTRWQLADLKNEIMNLMANGIGQKTFQNKILVLVGHCHALSILLRPSGLVPQGSRLEVRNDFRNYVILLTDHSHCDMDSFDIACSASKKSGSHDGKYPKRSCRASISLSLKSFLPPVIMPFLFLLGSMNHTHWVFTTMDGHTYAW